MGGMGPGFGGFPGGSRGPQMDGRRAQEVFSMFFGGEDPFASFGGGMHDGMPGNIRVQVMHGPGGSSQMFSNMNSGFPGMGPMRRQVQPKATARYDVLPMGARVVLMDLVAKPERNDDIGVIERFDATKGRYQVKLEDDGEVLASAA